MASPGQAAQDMPAPAIKQALAGPWHTGRQAYADRRAFLEQIASLAAENGLTAEEALARCKAALRSASDVESTASADSDLELATPVQRQRPVRHGFFSPTPSPAAQPDKQKRPVCYSIANWCKSPRSRQSSTVHSRAAHSMPCSTQHAEQTEQHAACHAAHSIMQSSMQHIACSLPGAALRRAWARSLPAQLQSMLWCLSAEMSRLLQPCREEEQL